MDARRELESTLKANIKGIRFVIIIDGGISVLVTSVTAARRVMIDLSRTGRFKELKCEVDASIKGGLMVNALFKGQPA